MIKFLGFLILLCLPLTLLGQVDQEARQPRGQLQAGDSSGQLREKQSSEEKDSMPPITDYKIISVKNDTTFVDTTLTIYKDYKFNYLRKDNFELLPFSNAGQPYTELGYSFQGVSTMPDIGARTKHFAFYDVNDIYYYNVPTPFTELFFKTTFEQGQNVDAFFTTNLSPRLNFSIAYRGLRSLGKYQHILASQGSFRFTVNYQTKNNRYDLKTHFVSQDINNQENGGLSSLANRQFQSNSGEFDDRSVLEPNFQDAENLLFAKRFFVKHHYKVIKGNDSTENNQVRLGHILDFTDKEYSYEQKSAFPEYGLGLENSDLKDNAEYQNVSNTLFTNYRNRILGKIGFKVNYSHFNYGYKSKLILDSDEIPNRLKGGIVKVGGSYAKHIGGFDLQAEAMLNLTGDFTGNYLKGKARYQLDENNKVEAALRIDSHAPNYNFLLFQSDYANYNWRNKFDNVQTQNLSLHLDAKKIAEVEADFTQINNYAYFGFRDNPDTNSRADTLVTPYQYGGSVSYLKLKVHKKFTFGRFSLDNTLMYQNVFSGNEVFRVPDFVTRNTFYYQDYWFHRALFLQTGFMFRYFNGYKANAYDPVLSEFVVQDAQALKGFSTVDFFFNAKVRQARIFFKLENFTTLFQGNANYSAPIHPYRDFIIRFGIVWDFFL